MIKVTIDGNSVEVVEGTTVLQAARQAGVHIPTLCNHPAIKPYGGCRLCVVEIEGARGLQASCTLPVFPNMVVHTDTDRLRTAREFVLTLLFSERNHFCMYCQKSGGDCELQNAAYGEGMTHWPLPPVWKTFPIDTSHPYFAFDHNRCILCRRCVRACAELVGNYTLNLEERGANAMIVSDAGVPAGESSCIRCGTCVQICPTGALIDRASAYLGLETQTEDIPSICLGCSVGCGITAQVRDNQLVRLQGDWNSPVNGGLMCETGRYLWREDWGQRLNTPMVRVNGQLEPATWGYALQRVALQLQSGGSQGNLQVAALASSRLSLESLAAFQELFVDHLAAGMAAGIEENFTTALAHAPELGGSLDDLKAADCVVVVGADLVKRHPVAGFFVKRKLMFGTRLFVINPEQNEMADLADLSVHPKPGSDEAFFNGLLASLGGSRNGALSAAAEATGLPAKVFGELAEALRQAKAPVIVYGKGVTQTGSQPLMQLLEKLARATKAKLINPAGKANSLALHRLGLDRAFNAAGAGTVVVALGDDHGPRHLAETFTPDQFVVVLASKTSALTDAAHVVFPVGNWAEQDGHYLNLEGRVQAAAQIVEPAPQVRSNAAAISAIAESINIQLDNNWQQRFSVAPAGAAA